MPAVSSIIAGVALASSATGAAVSHRQQRKASKKQKRSNQLEQKKSDISRARANSQALASQQTNLASQQAQGSASGIGSSSVLSGAQGSVQTSTASNIGFADQINALVGQQNDLAQQAANNMRTAGTASSVGNTIGSALGTASAFAGSKTTPRIQDPGLPSSANPSTGGLYGRPGKI
jgi:hypothetical protein